MFKKILNLFKKKVVSENNVVNKIEPKEKIEEIDSERAAKIAEKHTGKLREVLDELSATLLPKFEKEALDNFGRHESGMKQDNFVGASLSSGDKIIDFELPNQYNQVVKFSEILGENPTVLTFYRGGWCLYCNLQLRYLQEALPDFNLLGAKLIAISPEAPENAKVTSSDNQLGYTVLSDLESKVSRQFQVGYKVPDYLLGTYQKMGLDLSKINKAEEVYLPLTAAYVIDPDMTVRYAWVTESFRERADVGEILKSIITINRERRAKKVS